MATEAKPSSVVTVTLQARKYEIDIQKLTGHERREAKRLLEVQTFSLMNLIEDEVGLYVLAYLAAKRVQPTLSFDDVLDLTADQVTVDFSGGQDTVDPFGEPAKPERKGKASSDPSSTKD